MPQFSPIANHYAGMSPGAASADMGLTLAGVVGAIVGPGEKAGFPASVVNPNAMRHFIFNDGGTPIGEAVVHPPVGKPPTLNVEHLELYPEARGGLAQMRDIVRQLLDYYPGAENVNYLRTTGASAANGPVPKSFTIPKP